METIAFVTCSSIPDLTEDDRLTVRPLRKLGVKVEAAIWDDPLVAWQKYEWIILRSCWDYHFKPRAFEEWLGRIKKEKLPLLNPCSVVAWNSRKNYLEDLEKGGIPVVPTLFIEKGKRVRLQDIFKTQKWEKLVIKPAVSAGAHRTWISTPASVEQDEKEFQELVRGEMLLVQPFLKQINEGGEWSFIFFNGKFSHAVVKKPKEGDFRVQEKHGGSTQAKKPSESLLKQAGKVLSFVEDACLYARVDGVEIGGKLHLMELELIEPSLFFSTDPEAPERFAQAVQSRLH